MSGKIRRRPEPAEFVMRHVKDVPLTYLNDAGEQVQENFSLDFKSYTAFGFMKLNEDMKEMTFLGEEHVACELLARSITAIIDAEGHAVTDESGEPATLTAGFFMGMLEEDREAIQAAVRSDANPLKQTSAPGPSGSSTKASAA